MSTDPAHSLSDSLQYELGAKPTSIAQNLWGQEVQAQVEMERNWSSVQRWLGNLLTEQGVDQIIAEELTVPPGTDELFSLLQIKDHHESGKYDVIVVDCAPTGETLRLLSFPDVARWWLERVFPWERRVVSAARPFAKTILNLDLPGEDVFSDVRRLVHSLISMNEILRDHSSASIRLVMNPDRMVIREAQRTYTYLNLYGFLTDAVVVNRVFPADVEGGYFDAWRNAQQEQMDLVRSAFEPVPVLTAPYFDREVIGQQLLEQLGDQVFGADRAQDLLHQELSQQLSLRNGHAELCLSIPFADKSQIELKKIGLELIVKVADQKRTIMLPTAMAAYRPSNARFESGALRVTFDKQDRVVEEDAQLPA